MDNITLVHQIPYQRQPHQVPYSLSLTSHHKLVLYTMWHRSLNHFNQEDYNMEEFYLRFKLQVLLFKLLTLLNQDNCTLSNQCQLRPFTPLTIHSLHLNHNSHRYRHLKTLGTNGTLQTFRSYLLTWNADTASFFWSQLFHTTHS